MPDKAHTFGSIEEFRQAARTSPEPVADAHVRASFDTEVKAKEDGSRTLTFTISSAAVDRYGDSVSVEGWQLENYRKNPVVLWAHDSTSLPVGKADKVWTESGKLKADALFTPAGMAKFNDTVFDMYKQGFLSATSVGFLPLKYAFVDDPERRYGIDFLQQELLEFSCVPVPANPEALVEGKAAGIDITPVLDWCEQLVKRHAGAERIIKLAESVVGSSGTDAVLLGWAERLIKANGQAIVSVARVDRVERAAKQARLQRSVTVARLRGK